MLRCPKIERPRVNRAEARVAPRRSCGVRASRYSSVVLRACMIDGFGWFAEASYRRSWLFFDEVDYIFPNRSAFPGYPPRWAASARDFALARPELPVADLEALFERVRICCDAEFRALVAANVPEKDARYAVSAVSFDEDLRPLREKTGLALEPAFALAFLAAKLLETAERTGSVPIFGRPYARRSSRVWLPLAYLRRATTAGC